MAEGEAVAVDEELGTVPELMEAEGVTEGLAVGLAVAEGVTLQKEWGERSDGRVKQRRTKVDAPD